MHGGRIRGLPPKSLYWFAGSKRDLSAFPVEVRYRVGHALWEAQCGGKSSIAKPLRGFGGAGVLEVVDDFDGNAYRAVSTVRFADAVCVLHVFQKKSRSGIATLKTDVDTIRRRLAIAERSHPEWQGSR